MDEEEYLFILFVERELKIYSCFFLFFFFKFHLSTLFAMQQISQLPNVKIRNFSNLKYEKEIETLTIRQREHGMENISVGLFRASFLLVPEVIFLTVPSLLLQRCRRSSVCSPVMWRWPRGRELS